MKPFLLALCMFSLMVSGSIAQEPNFPVTNFTTKEYGSDFHPTNMAIVQDFRGIIYAANAFKLLEYDGHSWNSYPINKEAWILSLAVDSAGIVYAGSQNEFGFFAPDKVAGLKYCSLSDSLDAKEMDFTNIWKVHTFSGGVVFQAEEKLFIFRNGKIEVISPSTSFHTSFIVNDVLYIRERGIGLMQWDGKKLTKIQGSELFENTGIFLMVPFGKKKNEIFIGTQDSGFQIFNYSRNENTFRPFTVSDKALFERSKVTGGVLTTDGSIAISTMLDGIIIIDTAGHTLEIINRKSGLADNDVKQVITDKNQNLWLALNNGISAIENTSPLSFYSEKSGIHGSIDAVIRHKGLLYAGTSTGLFIQKTKPLDENIFLPVPGLSSPVRSLAEADGSLFAGTDAGLYELNENVFQKIGDAASYSLYYSRKMKILLSGGSKGLSIFRIDGQMRRKIIPEEIKTDIIAIAEKESDNSDSSEFWIGTRYEGTIRISFYRDLSCRINHYHETDGLTSGPVIPYNFNGNVIFGTIRGLYSFTPENIVKETLPDSLKNNKEFLRGYFSSFSITSDSIGKSISSIVENPEKIWMCSDNKPGYFKKENLDRLIKQPFLGIEAGKINTIYPDINGICWFGTTDGLIRYDEKTGKNYNTTYYSLIRKVSLLKYDMVLFKGTNFIKYPFGYKITFDQPESLKPVLTYRNNSLRFEFSASFFEYMEKIMFSCQLEGYDSTWTDWEHKYYQEYTNLNEGSYTFRVKTINAFGKQSEEAEYSFAILPPWYRSVAAYILYAISAILFVWLIARLYSYRLKRENIRLEGIVAERTSEVVRQKDEIEKKNTVLEFQKKEIEDSIRYALRIQSSVIPTERECLNLFPESFVLFKPLNIVSGDFYWISRVGSKIIFTAADCTGHGVPGAFMSMLGVAFLNEIVNKDLITEPDAILNHLREKVIQALQQQGISGEARDGMDIALVCIDTKEKKLQYAGAYNPLIMIRNNKIFETAGDKMPIGIYEKMDPFTKHEINLEKGDVFYMASDGYEDQFGGPHGKKFKAKKFKQMLLEIHKYPMNSQKEIIERLFEEWKGDLQQVDDIVVTGIAIK